MFKELDTVVLTHDVAAHGLERGDIGVVAHRYDDGVAFEVEFVTASGATIALLTLTGDDIRLMDDREILHTRLFEPALS